MVNDFTFSIYYLATVHETVSSKPTKLLVEKKKSQLFAELRNKRIYPIGTINT